MSTARWPHPSPPRVGSTVTLGVAGLIGPVVGKVTGFDGETVSWEITDDQVGDLVPVFDPDGFVHVITRSAGFGTSS
jgi:hypothetical protein